MKSRSYEVPPADTTTTSATSAQTNPTFFHSAITATTTPDLRPRPAFTVGQNLFHTSLARRPSRSPSRQSHPAAHAPSHTTSSSSSEEDIDDSLSHVPDPAMDPERTRRRTMRTHQTRPRNPPHPNAPALLPSSPRPRTGTNTSTSTASTLQAPSFPPRKARPVLSPSSLSRTDPFSLAPHPVHQEQEPEISEQGPVFYHAPSFPSSSSFTRSTSRPGLVSKSTGQDFITLIPPLILPSHNGGDDEEDNDHEEDIREREAREVDRRLSQACREFWAAQAAQGKDKGRGRGSGARGSGGRQRKGTGDEEEWMGVGEEIMARLREGVDERVEGERWRWEGGDVLMT
ncbi:Hypothetical protein D9617_24g016510 [Elsinoe fawcettii]|nr:Hypothetical protein D9617_24g016510 [Elsinoe fawcettii]